MAAHVYIDWFQQQSELGEFKRLCEPRSYTRVYRNDFEFSQIHSIAWIRLYKQRGSMFYFLWNETKECAMKECENIKWLSLILGVFVYTLSCHLSIIAYPCWCWCMSTIWLAWNCWLCCVCIFYMAANIWFWWFIFLSLFYLSTPSHSLSNFQLLATFLFRPFSLNTEM